MSNTQRAASRAKTKPESVDSDAPVVAINRAPETISFPFDGDSYTIPVAEDWPIEVIEYAEDGLMTRALRSLLGDEQWATFKANHPTVKSLREFFEAAGEAVGTGN